MRHRRELEQLALPEVGRVRPAGLQVEALRFLPSPLAIRAGDTVRWTNQSPNGEPHTVTLLGGEEPPEFILVEPQAAGPPKLVVNPAVLYAAGGPAYDGTEYANSGVLSQGFPEFYEGFEGAQSYELTFEAPGEYRYFCAIHAGGPDDPEGMVGTIVVS